MESLWGFVIIGGPLLLLIALVASRMLNRRSGVSLAETEAATRRMQQEQSDEDQARGSS
ncbi:MAG TPA: hypothetical protein VM900_04125 [Sphingomonas sp.]|jgi:uncharacterized membrane protein|nr:hypothetical protein [Sphingomonas sp.]